MTIDELRGRRYAVAKLISSPFQRVPLISDSVMVDSFVRNGIRRYVVFISKGVQRLAGLVARALANLRPSPTLSDVQKYLPWLRV